MIRRPWRHTVVFRSNIVVSIASCWLVTLTFGSIATAQNPVPLINQPLVPDAVKPGGTGFTLTVNGTGFVSGSVVDWNGSARATTFVNSSKLTASIAASDIASAHTARVTVVSPAPGGGTSNVVSFEVTPSSTAFGFEATNTGTYSGIFSTSVVVGDFNRDGRLDLAVANLVTNNVSVLLGKGDGTFQAPVDYGIGGGPNCCDTSRIALGDFNGDGKLDLAVANYTDDNVSLLLGNGDGTFQAAVNYSAGSGPWSVTVGDFNGDGKLDLAVANSNSNNVSVLLGNGDGTFQAVANYGAGVAPMAVTTGDFNRDGRLDLAVANDNGNNVSVLLGNGDGTFQPASDYAVGGGPRSIALGDFNGDGNLDIAAANVFDSSVSILLGKGDGTFQ